MMGRDYDAAMVRRGFFDLGLGVTPVIIASMHAVSKEHGPSMEAILIVPLVGAFFIDLLNAAMLETFLRLPFMQ